MSNGGAAGMPLPADNPVAYATGQRDFQKSCRDRDLRKNSSILPEVVPAELGPLKRKIPWQSQRIL